MTEPARPDRARGHERPPATIPAADQDRHLWWSWRRGLGTAWCAATVAALLACHAAVPNAVGRLGSLLETFLPWLGASVPLLAGVGLWRRSRSALLALLLPVAAWSAIFGPRMMPATGPVDLVVVQHNVSDENPDPAGTARALASAAPDLIAVQEVLPETVPRYAAALAGRYPYHAVHGTVGLWSTHPLTQARPLDIRPRGLAADWNRALRAVVRTPRGDVAVYVAHLPSVRLSPSAGFSTDRRDDSAARLGAAVAADPAPRVVLVGDLNGTVDDRGLRPLAAQLTWPESGFALSWPARAPVARIDHVMARGATVTAVRALPPTGSDHRPVAARLRL